MKVTIFTLSGNLMKIFQIPPFTFQTTSWFFFKFSVFLVSSVPWYIYMCKFFRLFSARIKIQQILLIFEKKKKNLQIFHYSSVSWDITPLYLFSWNFIYFQQKKPIKVQIWWNFTWAVESLKFCTVVGSFCKNQIKFQLKKYRRLISHDTEEWCKV